MEDVPRKLVLGGGRPKKPKVPNPANDARRARQQAARQGEPPPPPVVPEPRGPMSAIPSFDDGDTLSNDYTLLTGVIGPVINQHGETCGSVVLCRLLQACYNRNKDIPLHLEFSIRDLADYVKTKTDRLILRNLNIALTYILKTGLLKKPDGKDPPGSSQGLRIYGRFEVRNGISRDEVYHLLEDTPLGISVEDRLTLKALKKHEIYDVPVERGTMLGHAMLIVAKGVTRNGKEFLVVQNSWDNTWCNQGYGRIWLDPRGKFDVYWAIEASKVLG